MKIPALQDIFSDAARAIGPCRLFCQVCRAERKPTKQQVAIFLSISWPKCYGQTMSLERAEGGGE